MPDPNLALNGLAFDALQALALIFTLLATTLLALLLLALGLAAGTQTNPFQKSAAPAPARRLQGLAAVPTRYQINSNS